MRIVPPRLTLTMLCGIVLVYIAVLTLDACRQGVGKPVVANIPVNPAFEMAPPLATAVDIQKLDKNDTGNVLFTAAFAKGEIQGDLHAVLLGDDDKVVLRDDGKGGDKTAGDGIFSIVLKDDLEAMQKQMDSINIKLSQRRTINVFRGRTMVEMPVEKLDIKSFERFKAGGIFHIDPSIFAIAADPVLKDHSLTVTDPGVVSDTSRTFNPCSGVGNPNGAWAFGKLVTDMAGSSGVTPKDFLLQWLQTWQTDQTVNGDVIAKRTAISQIISAWSTLSGGSFDIKFAPFKLLAIVNRVDLRGNSGYGFGNPGEGRFVFCATTPTCGVLRNPAPFMVIFEYGLPKHTCASLKAYAQQWYALRLMTPGTPAYNAALEAITVQFTAANAEPSKPNGSALNQVRTNELAIGNPWELREFNIDATTHLLKNVTVKQEPQVTFNRQQTGFVPADVLITAQFVNDSTTKIEANKYTVPLTAGGKNFLAGKAHTLNPTTYHWNANTAAPGFITSDSARFVFSLNTCSGCHGGEANTGNFMHVAPAFTATGVPAILSKFLTGDPAMSASPFLVADRANRPTVASPRIRGFNDLEFRALDLESFVTSPCRPVTKAFTLARILTKDIRSKTH
ncbi:MAG: hypothetical protein QM731_12245 [Chitinophagaceae bacterium]